MALGLEWDSMILNWVVKYERLGLKENEVKVENWERQRKKKIY